MMAWGGWGAGPAGAGSQTGSKIFVGIGLGLATVMCIDLAREGKGWEAAVAAAAAIYFALRLFGGLGRRRE